MCLFFYIVFTINHKSIKMKKFIVLLIFCFVFNLGLSQERLAINSYRKVPANELQTFMQNEAFYWSKVAAILKEKGQITAWAIHIRSGGMLESEPNINTRIGIGSWENYENLNKNYTAAIAEVKSKMDPEKLALLDESLKQDKFEFATILTNTDLLIWSDKEPSFNYTVINYSKANNVNQYLSEESRIMKPFFEKLMKQGKTKLKGWATTRVLAPLGYEYPYNSYTVDFYEKISDIFSPFNVDEITWPEEMSSLGDLKTPGFWKRVIWQRVMYLNQKNELVQRW